MNPVEQIIQNYLGMTPNDKNCQNWSEMQSKMYEEIMSALGLLTPNEMRKGYYALLDDWHCSENSHWDSFSNEEANKASEIASK